jgi:hypothetical protein
MTVATVVARNSRDVVMAPVWGLESGGLFCVGAFGRNLATVAVKIFLHLIYFIRIF